MHPIQYRWQWEVHGSPCDIWHLIADAKPLLHALGKFSTPLLEDTPNWVHNSQYSAQVKWEKGPLSTMDFAISLEPSEDKTIIKHHILITPKNLIGKLLIPFAFAKRIHKDLGKTYEEMNNHLQSKEDTLSPSYSASFSPLTESGATKLEEASQTLLAEGFRNSWVKQLTQTIAVESDQALRTLQPHLIAEKWGIPKKRAADLLLSASKAGILRIQWQLICPKCLKGVALKPSLRKFHKTAHCPKCDVHFHMHLARNVELTFTPAPQIRKDSSSSATASFHSSTSSSHIFIQQSLDPQEIRQLNEKLPPGKYRLRTLDSSSDQWVNLDLNETAFGELSAEIFPEQLKVHHTPKTAQTKQETLRIGNRTDIPQTFYVEELSWKQEILSATQAITHQHFRNLFPEEVLPPGIILPTGKMALMHIDILNSTQLFREKGDVPSFLFLQDFKGFLELIFDHHDGAINRIVNDSLIASFIDPRQGPTRCGDGDPRLRNVQYYPTGNGAMSSASLSSLWSLLCDQSQSASRLLW